MKLTEITIEEAVGKPLAHDLTKIDAKARTKDARFKKGHIVQQEDLPVLRDMGKEHLVILELAPDEMHEDDAAIAMRDALAGSNVIASDPNEGRITLRAAVSGLLTYDVEMVHAVNEDDEWVLATLPPQRHVSRGEPVAGFRIVPLALARSRVERAVSAAKHIDVLPYRPLKVGLVTTGKELAEGRIEDVFKAKLERKLELYGGTLIGRRFSNDVIDETASAIRAFIDEGAELVICSGGMSVDPDDRTPGAIRDVADRISFRGAPILPGSMLMLGWAGEVAIVGAPACVAHDDRTALDAILPAIFAGSDPTPYIRRRGVGGLCEHCAECHWPNCSFSPSV